MSETQKTSTNIEALVQVENAVHRVTTLISAVLRKFPAHTLHEKIRPFRSTHDAHAVRRSVKDEDIVLVASSFFHQNSTLRFPIALLDAPEQAITRWARDQYWSGVEGSKHQKQQAARVTAAKARQTLEKAQRDYNAAEANLTAAWRMGKKKRPQAKPGVPA